MSTFRKADPHDGADQVVARLFDRQYKELKDAGVTVEVIFAFAPKNENEEPTGPALKHHGWPACATVKVNSQKDRAAGLADVRVVVDGDAWPEWNAKKRECVFDHELYHLVVKRDAEGQVATDDCHRPKLKLREHDFQMGGFYAIVERHGQAAVEAQAVHDAWTRVRQLTFWPEEEPAVQRSAARSTRR